MVLVLASDQMLTCPLDESHRIRKERMQFHLVKCMKNHSLENKIKCPWNPLHIISKFEWENHFTHECENMPAALEFVYTSEEQKDIAYAPVLTDFSWMPHSSENWDAEPVPLGTYDAFEISAEKPVLRTMIGLSKAKKKEWRLAERKRFQDLEAKGPLPLKQLGNTSQQQQPSTSTGARRAPKSKPISCSADTSLLKELDTSRRSNTENDAEKKPQQTKLRRPHTPPHTLMNTRPTKPPRIAAGFGMARDTDAETDTASVISSGSRAKPRDADVHEKIRTLFDKSVSSVAADYETEEDISQRMAQLSTMEKSIRNEKAELHEKAADFVPKLVSSSSSARISGNESDASTLNGRESPIRLMPKLVTGSKISQKPIAKLPGFGRGACIVDLTSQGRYSSRDRVGGNLSRNYAVSSSSIDELGAAFGYDADD